MVFEPIRRLRIALSYAGEIRLEGKITFSQAASAGAYVRGGRRNSRGHVRKGSQDVPPHDYERQHLFVKGADTQAREGAVKKINWG